MLRSTTQRVLGGILDVACVALTIVDRRIRQGSVITSGTASEAVDAGNYWCSDAFVLDGLSEASMPSEKLRKASDRPRGGSTRTLLW